MTRTILAAAALALLAGCSPEPVAAPEPDGTAASPSPAAEASDSPPADAAIRDDDRARGRQRVYTSLGDCKVVRREREEMPFTEVECPGPAGFALRIADSDARQSMTVVDPGGTAHRLATARIGGGGFSAFGKTAEWRGDGAPGVDGGFEPDSLIVRYEVTEDPYPAPETSYLLVVRLAGDPCIVARIPPGPGQNDSARDAADDPGACLAG